MSFHIFPIILFCLNRVRLSLTLTLTLKLPLQFVQTVIYLLKLKFFLNCHFILIKPLHYFVWTIKFCSNCHYILFISSFHFVRTIFELSFYINRIIKIFCSYSLHFSNCHYILLNLPFFVPTFKYNFKEFCYIILIF